MIKYYILLFFIIYANAHYWDSLKVIEDNIDDDVDPCDDFYRHMCARNKPEETTWSRLLHKAYYDDVGEIYNRHVPKTLHRIMEQGFRMSQGYEVAPLEMLSAKYLEICQTNSTEALILLKTLESFFGREATEPCWGYLCFTNLALDSNCQRASETLKKGAIALLDGYQEQLEYIRKTYYNIFASIWALLHQDEFRQSSEMFTFFKEELLKSIEITPWLLNSNTMEIFYNITSQMRLTLPNEKIEQTFNNTLDHQFVYDDCVETYEILDSFATEYCFLLSLPGFAEEHELGIANAVNQHPEITIMNQFMLTMSDNGSIALRYGFIGSVLGHEMGHSVILKDLNDGFYPYYSNEINPCIQQQFNKTCNAYKEGSCKVEDKQIDENGSDIFGIPFAYDRLKQKMGDKIYDKIVGSKRRLTHAQAFFYTVLPFVCQRRDVYESENDPHGHSAHNIRVNAGVIQIPDFGKVFKCSKNSRMMLSKSKQCHIFGENAPQH